MALSQIFQYARETPDKVAVVHDDVACTYAQFAGRIDACSRQFATQRLHAGTVAVIDVRNLLDAWILGFALRASGLTTVAVKDGGEIDALGIANVGCVVTSAAEDRPARALDAGARPWRRIQASTAPDPASPSGAHGEWSPPANAGGHIMMTSGTTGTYKKVVRDAAAEALALPLHATINEITGHSVVYTGNFGLWTAGGYRWPLITWSAGGTVVIHQGPDMHGSLARHAVTHAFATPGTLPDLLRPSHGTRRRNDEMRLMVTGGALPQFMLDAARRDLTRRVYAVLASTEALTVAVTPLDASDDLYWHRVHPSREVQIVDDAHRVLGPGREGLVRIRVIDGLRGYLDDDAATRAFFRDGYFYPGDIGVLGADGRLSLRGRASDVVNVLGDKVATGAIEQAMQDALGARGVCVVALPTPVGRDEIYVVIEPGRPLASAEIRAVVNALLGTLKRLPVRSVLAKALPRSEAGKVDRLQLKRQLLAALGDGREPRGDLAEVDAGVPALPPALRCPAR